MLTPKDVDLEIDAPKDTTSVIDAMRPVRSVDGLVNVFVFDARRLN
jgi:hypothetical protein